VAFLDADDTWLREYLATQLRVAAAEPHCDVVYANALFVGNTPLAGRRFMDVCPSRGEVTPMSLLSLQCQIPLSATMVRRQAVVDAGLFDSSLRRGQDFDLWLRLALRGVRFAHHPTVLMHHRIHEDNLSGGLRMRLERATSVFNKAITQLSLNPQEREVARQQVRRFEAELAIEHGKELLAQGDFAAARTALTAAQRTAARWKVHAALIALRVAPHLLRRVYLARA
jgi:GT2 family glycosyltransferase